MLFLIYLTGNRKIETSPIRNVPNSSNHLTMKKKGFTLIEVMVALSIFMIISGIVLTVIVTGFRSFNQGQKMARDEQRKRFVFFRLGKELSSLTRISYPGSYFQGEEKSFFLFLTRRIT